MTYTAEQVKEMATAKGLPCEISKRKGISIVSPASTLEALGIYREWSKYIAPDPFIGAEPCYESETQAHITAFMQCMDCGLELYPNELCTCPGEVIA